MKALKNPRQADRLTPWCGEWIDRVILTPKNRYVSNFVATASKVISNIPRYGECTMEMVESPLRPLNKLDSDAVEFPRDDGSRVPYKVFSSQAVYDREQERIFRGP